MGVRSAANRESKLEQYPLKTSKTLLIGLLGCYALGALLMLVWLEPVWLGGCAAVLCLLFALQDYRLATSEAGVVLSVDRRRARIALERAGQPYFFGKYKVYPTRWFAILRLEDPQQNRTLFLRPDRFTSPRSYHDCRYALRQMESGHAA